MQKITSVNNELVKETVKLQQKKYRDKTDKFLLEGYKCIEEAFHAGLELEYVFVLKEKIEEYLYLGACLISTSNPVLKKISTTDSAPDAVAVARKKLYSVEDLKNAKKVVLLENIKDLGNLGTVLRSSVAFGADAVVLYGKECADLYNPKCVRSTVGNLWKIPVVYLDDFLVLRELFGNFERIATLPRAKKFLKECKVKAPLLVMFGSEADGLSNELIEFSTKHVKIEMSDRVESLNLSVSCAVVLYELFV